MSKTNISAILNKPDLVKNILIVRQHNQLGDMLCSVPLFESIKKKYPHAHITLVASPMNYEILLNDINPFIDEVLVYDKKPADKIKKFYKELRKRKYQIGIVPSTVAISRTSHIINYLSGAIVRVGAKRINDKVNKLAYLLNIKSEFDWDKERKHQIERNLDIGRQIDCDLPLNERTIKLVLNENEDKYGSEYITQHFNNEDVIAFHPGAGKVPNRWDVNNFYELIKMFKKGGYKNFLITSGSIDYEVTKILTDKLTGDGIPYDIPPNFKIRNEAAILKHVSVYITNDTGMMHVAAGVGTKVVSLFGPTHGYEWAPSSEKQTYVQSPTTDINEIKVTDVFETAIKLLKNV